MKRGKWRRSHQSFIFDSAVQSFASVCKLEGQPVVVAGIGCVSIDIFWIRQALPKRESNARIGIKKWRGHKQSRLLEALPNFSTDPAPRISSSISSWLWATMIFSSTGCFASGPASLKKPFIKLLRWRVMELVHFFFIDVLEVIWLYTFMWNRSLCRPPFLNGWRRQLETWKRIKKDPTHAALTTEQNCGRLCHIQKFVNSASASDGTRCG